MVMNMGTDSNYAANPRKRTISRRSWSPSPYSRGFSLLELIMVISIVAILVGAALFPAWKRSEQQAREVALVHALHVMRQTINNYVADRRKLPETLDALVDGGYFKEVPIDPITKSRTWSPDIGKLHGSSNFGLSGITDVHSLSQDIALDGSPYNTW
jgi:general secretion pathway protein G